MKPEDRFDSLIQYWASVNALPWELVKAQMMVESGGRPNAISSSGAMGLMQIMPGTAHDLGVDDPYNPDQALKGSTIYVAKLLGEVQLACGGLSFQEEMHKMAIAAYNCGPGYVLEAIRLIRISSGVPSWSLVREALGRAEVHGRKARLSEVESYVAKIWNLFEASGPYVWQP